MVYFENMRGQSTPPGVYLLMTYIRYTPRGVLKIHPEGCILARNLSFVKSNQSDCFIYGACFDIDRHFVTLVRPQIMRGWCPDTFFPTDFQLIFFHFHINSSQFLSSQYSISLKPNIKDEFCDKQPSKMEPKRKTF